MSEPLVWMDPPPNGAGRPGIDWKGVVRELAAHPGEWALVAEATRGPGNLKGAAQDLGVAVEFVTRNNRKNSEGKRIADVFARAVAS